MEINEHERLTINDLRKQGRTIIATQPYRLCTEKVREVLAVSLRNEIETASAILFNDSALASVPDLINLLFKVNPNVTFYQYKAFDILKEQEQLVRSCIIHDTVDNQIKQAIGINLAEMYQLRSAN